MLNSLQVPVRFNLSAVPVCIILIFFSVLAVIPAQAGSVSDNTVTLKYKDAINGMRVEALWKPNELRNGYVIGPAIIQLTNIKYGTSSTVVNNKLGIPDQRLGGLISWHEGKDGEKTIQSIAQKEIVLDYKKPDLKGDAVTFEEATDEPFFLYDVNFDGKEDLLVVEMFTGQRFRSTFKAYEFEADQDIFLLKDDYLQITAIEPYILLDEATVINKAKKTVTINNSSGAADSDSVVYRLKHDPNYGQNRLTKD